MKLVQIKETINNSELSIDDLTELSRHIENRLLQLNTDDFMQEGIDRKFCQNFSCIHCKSTKVVKNGKTSKGKQKYLCKSCKGSFVMTSNSMISHTKLDLSVWVLMIKCIIEGKTLRETAKLCSISLRTAFFDRHKIMSAIENKNKGKELSGITECDDTSLNISYSGNHNKQETKDKLPRPSYKRGRKNSKRYEDQITDRVQIATAVDRSGKVFLKLAKIGTTVMSTEAIKEVYTEHLKKVTVLCTDKNGGYNYLAKDLNCEHYAFGSKSNEKRGIYHINHVNYVHSYIKNYWDQHHGISVKYINHYLNLLSYLLENKNVLTREFFCDIFCAPCDFKVKNYIGTPFY